MIVRRRHTGKYTVIDHSGLNDTQVSLAALGLYVWICAGTEEGRHPDDALARFGIDRDRLDALLRELQTANLIEAKPL